MGVDFHDCPICGEWYCDAGDYFSCESCGYTICDDCAKKYNAGPYYEEPDDPNKNDDAEGCPFCNLLVISTDDLFEFLLEKLKINRDELEKEYKEWKEMGRRRHE
jgi:hypothetical protein